MNTKRFTAIEQPDDELINGLPCFQLLDENGMDYVGEYITRDDVMKTTEGDVFFKFD